MARRILIVDDEESLRSTFQLFLSKEGYEVETVDSYEDALDRLESKEFDLVFADIVLKGRSGIELLKNVRERNLQCQVIIITGQPSLDTARETVQLGAYDYVQKPIRKGTLLRLAQQALRQKEILDDKRRVEEERERYRQNLDAIFQSVKDALISIDEEMRIVEMNHAAQALLETSREESLHKDCRDVVSEFCEECGRLLDLYGSARRPVQEFRIDCSCSEVKDRVFIVNISPMRRDGADKGALLTIRDISRLSALEEDLKERSRFHDLVGVSASMQRIYGLIEGLADSDASVLIMGESGTGKELVARALHELSPRAGRPMICVNCSALAEGLLESELFGHVKGAFTGAVRDNVGRFHAADGGTIFLDEIGDLSPALQAKLLRVLQERQFERVGDITPIKVDVRIIAATNRDLKERITQGRFREDLYYRLKVVQVAIAPLRERTEDVPVLAEHFRETLNREIGRNIAGFAEDTMEVLQGYSWPGNVRELGHAIEHAFVLCKGSLIAPDHLPEDLLEDAESPKPGTQGACTAEALLEALGKTDWNKAKAARILRVSRQTIYRKILEYGIEEPGIR